MKKIPLKFQWHKLTVALAFALCVAGVAFAAQLQRRSIKATPLSLTTENPILLPIDRQVLPSRSADPARDISQASPLPAGVGKQAYIRKVEAVDVPEVDIYASILEDNKGTTMGLYSIPSTGGEFTRITYGPFAQNGGVYQDGYYFYSFADTYMGVKVYYSFL